MSISALCEHEAASDLRQAVTTIATVGRLLTSTIWYLSSAGNLGSSRLSSVERTIKMCVIPRFISLPNAHSRFRDDKRRMRSDKTRGTHSSLSFAEPYGPRKTPGRICLDAGQRAVSERRLSALLQRRARPSYGSAQRQSPKERLGCAPTGKNLLHLPAHLIRPLHEEVSAAQALRCHACVTLASPPLSRPESPRDRYCCLPPRQRASLQCFRHRASRLPSRG